MSPVLRIPDVYPGFRILIFVHPGSRISNPGSKNSNKRGGEKNLLSYLFCSHKNHKTENYIYLELVEKKIWANLQRILALSTQKLSLSSQK
jgi:hypothetical protein